jgi:tRNA U38,U39,U40 pseudouridine synthase TruA
MKEVLDAKDRTKAGPTVSPDGLTLIEVGYEPYRKNTTKNNMEITER